MSDAYGHPLCPAAADFLGDFLGLTLPWEGGWMIAPVGAIAVIGLNGLSDMSFVLRRSLYPVGWCTSAAVLMSSADEFFIIEEQWIGFTLFPTRESFLSAICGGDQWNAEEYLFDEATGEAVRWVR